MADHLIASFAPPTQPIHLFQVENHDYCLPIAASLIPHCGNVQLSLVCQSSQCEDLERIWFVFRVSNLTSPMLHMSSVFLWVSKSSAATQSLAVSIATTKRLPKQLTSRPPINNINTCIYQRSYEIVIPCLIHQRLKPSFSLYWLQRCRPVPHPRFMIEQRRIWIRY